MKHVKRIVTMILTTALLLPLVPMQDVQALPTRKPENGWVFEWTHDYSDDMVQLWDATYTGKATRVTTPKNVCEVKKLSDTVKELHLTGEACFGATQKKDARNLAKITVDANHPRLFAKDGVLYAKGKPYFLMYYPVQKKDRFYTVLPGTEEIKELNNNYLKKLTLPDSLKSIWQIRTKKVKTLHIPTKVNYIYEIDILGEITVAKNNKFFTNSKGVLFNKKKTEMRYYPATKKDKTYTIPKNVKEGGASKIINT